MLFTQKIIMLVCFALSVQKSWAAGPEPVSQERDALYLLDSDGALWPCISDSCPQGGLWEAGKRAGHEVLQIACSRLSLTQLPDCGVVPGAFGAA